MLTLPLWLFALVWLAAWAACWFGLARLRRTVTVESVEVPSMRVASRPGSNDWHDVQIGPPRRSARSEIVPRFPRSRAWAPLFATLLPFAADLVAAVLA